MTASTLKCTWQLFGRGVSFGRVVVAAGVSGSTSTTTGLVEQDPKTEEKAVSRPSLVPKLRLSFRFSLPFSVFPLPRPSQTKTATFRELKASPFLLSGFFLADDSRQVRLESGLPSPPPPFPPRRSIAARNADKARRKKKERSKKGLLLLGWIRPEVLLLARAFACCFLPLPPPSRCFLA